MKNLLKTALATIILTLPFSVRLISPAQGQSVSSLGEMPCYKVHEDQYRAINRDITIGFEVFRAVGELYVYGATGHRFFIKDRPIQTSCRLAENGEIPKYKTLTLALGLDSGNSYVSGSTVRLSVYTDGNLYGYQDISNGDKILWDVDIDNVRSLGLELRCLRASRRQDDACSGLYFIQDTLE